jgi:YD repeat-containing protein
VSESRSPGRLPIGATYDARGRVSTVTQGDRFGGSLAFTYDGSLPTGVTWSGEVSGAIGLAYNNNFELTRRTVNGANPVAFTYDGEGLLQQAGSLVLSRNAQTGLLTGTAVGGATDSYSYNDFGEVQSYAARQGGSDLFTESFTRDRRGRITQKVEMIGGATATYDYTYDAAGCLTGVKKDNVLFEHYDYDGNSNRTSWTDPVGSGTAAYDDQDRLLTYGGNTYAYSANGELATKTGNGQTIHYTYDVAGNLRTVLLPDGLQIDYVIDAANRRVGKKVNGVLGKGYLYKDGLSPVAELDGAGNLVTLFVYGSRLTVPAYMVRNGVTYRLFTDHLGSVRLVVNTTDGSIAQRLDYDAFGRVILDTNPGFQPFGFRRRALRSADRPDPLRRPRLRPRDRPLDEQRPGGLRWGRHKPLRVRGQRPGEQLRPQRALLLGGLAARCWKCLGWVRRYDHIWAYQEDPAVAGSRSIRPGLLGGLYGGTGWRRNLAASLRRRNGRSFRRGPRN